jgi:hypothetical protein
LHQIYIYFYTWYVLVENERIPVLFGTFEMLFPSFLPFSDGACIKKEVTTMSDTHFHNDHNTTAAIMTAPVSEWEGFTKAIIYK